MTNTPKAYTKLIERKPYYATVELLRDNQHVAYFENDFQLADYIHKHHCYSVDHATKHEGYTIRHNDKPTYQQQCETRHIDACMNPKPGFERALVRMLRGWLEYAEMHERQYESSIGDDYVLGPEWEAIGDALRGLLNGELGRLDGGTLDSILLDAMKDAGINTETK